MSTLIRKTKFNFDEDEDIFFTDDEGQQPFSQESSLTQIKSLKYIPLQQKQEFTLQFKSDSDVTTTELEMQQIQQCSYSYNTPTNMCQKFVSTNTSSICYSNNSTVQQLGQYENIVKNDNNQQKNDFSENQQEFESSHNNFTNYFLNQQENQSDFQLSTPINIVKNSQQQKKQQKKFQRASQPQYYKCNTKKIVLSKEEKYVFEMIQTNIIKSVYSMIKRYIRTTINDKETLKILKSYSLNQQMVLNKFFKIPRITNRVNFKIFLYDADKYQQGIKQYQYTQQQKENIIKVIRILTLKFFQQEYVTYLFTQKQKSTTYVYSHYYIKFKDNFIMAMKGEEYCLQYLKFGKQNL